MQWTTRALVLVVVGLAACVTDVPTGTTPPDAPAAARLAAHTAWGPAVNIEADWPGAHQDFNTPAVDGCPLPSRDGRLFFIASNRSSGGLGQRDIWVASRAGEGEPWGAPVNVGAPVNSEYNDYCPMLAPDGHTFYFVSDRPGPGTCGGTDIYVTRRRPDGTFDAPRNLGCHVNSAQNEEGPVPAIEPGRGPVLYFSSARPGGLAPEAAGAAPDFDLYVSDRRGNAYAAAALVPGVNSAQNDGQPYVSTEGTELYFYSDRTGGYGLADIYVATREHARLAWSAPANVGPGVNGAAAETRPSLSPDGTRLYFATVRPAPAGNGMADVFVARRERLR